LLASVFLEARWALSNVLAKHSLANCTISCRQMSLRETLRFAAEGLNDAASLRARPGASILDSRTDGRQAPCPSPLAVYVG